MDTVSAVILGLLQGLTEFLPISSSGHLAIGKRLLDFSSPDILFDVLLHAATLCAVLIFFRRRVMLIIKAFLGIFFKRFSLHYFENKRFLWGIVIASVPTGILGLLFKEYLLDYFQVTLFVGYALIFTSFILIVSDNFNGSERLTPFKSFLIGVAQGLAVIPGISRSGSTIAASVMLGIDREEAAEFSFLISVPAILAAVLLELQSVNLDTSMLIPYGAGMIAAFISGLIVIGIMMSFIRNAKLKVFAFYCLTVGMLTVLFL